MSLYAIHMLNDRSGSPRVLAACLREAVAQGANPILLCSKGPGFLSNIPGVEQRTIPYRLGSNKAETLVRYFHAQIWLFLHLLFRLQAGDAVYCNTLLPMGAALAGKLRGMRVVYHLHEPSVRPRALHLLLYAVAKWTATEALYVSDFLRAALPLPSAACYTVHNRLDADFTLGLASIRAAHPKAEQPTAVLLSSLRAYKGLEALRQLAKTCPEWQFRLVTPEPVEAAAAFYGGSMPDNLKAIQGNGDVRPEYAQAWCVLNLSLPDAWVESFGMTILEGMAFGIPAIVPPVGGPMELVQNGSNGYGIDPNNSTAIAQRLREWSTRPEHYAAACRSAQQAFAERQADASSEAWRSALFGPADDELLAEERTLAA